jgi:spore germination protein GerM
MKTLLLFPAVLLGAAMLAACGDDDDANGDGNGSPTPAATTTVTLVFPRVTATDIEFAGVTRTVASAANTSPQAVLELLLQGPTDAEATAEGVTNPFPDGVRVLSVNVDGGVATADFSAEILDYGGGSANVIAITGSIERTLLAQEGVTSVVILVEGEPDAIQP